MLINFILLGILVALTAAIVYLIFGDGMKGFEDLHTELFPNRRPADD